MPPAPIPTQILAGKSVFISYSGINSTFVSSEIMKLTGDTNANYDFFNASMRSWGWCELVSAPADADLIFEISLDYKPGVGNTHSQSRILDPETRVALWSFCGDLQKIKD
jgi:hypothetical protein